MASQKVLKVGMIGCGEISQVAHISTLGYLYNLFQITYLCDVSEDALNYCKPKVLRGTPATTKDPKELCASPEVDVVFVVNSTEYHAEHTILALQHDKHVFVEKPMALNRRDADAIIEAEKNSKGKVMVGYMRRYAEAFLDAVKEIGGIEKILYARVRDIIGPNANFVNQSGTFPKKFTDIAAEDMKDRNDKYSELATQGLLTECEVPANDDTKKFWNILGGLGSHDLSAMREVLGMPTCVLGASVGLPFWNALFQYPGFPCSYESGLDNVPRFDAHIEVYGMNKSVRIQYDSPYVKGLPTTLHIRENADGSYKETMVRKTYEDSYTQEFREFYAMVVENKPIKTTPQDAALDLDIFKMIIQAGHSRSSDGKALERR